MLNNGLTDPYIRTLTVNIFLKYFQAGLYYPKQVKTNDIYLRLHGPSQLYASGNDDHCLTDYVGILKNDNQKVMKYGLILAMICVDMQMRNGFWS